VPECQRGSGCVIGEMEKPLPRLPMRLMISLLYLKHTFDESDEGVLDRWSETPL
jgi:hypothetical protein